MNRNIQEFQGETFEETDPCRYEGISCVGCQAVGCQDLNVSIPVTIRPFGEVGNVRTQCLGPAVISSGEDGCFESHREVCKFTISQKLRVEVPVVFGARAEIGKAAVDCACTEKADGEMARNKIQSE